jgi:hypothetical protein
LYPDIAIFYGALYLVALFGIFSRLCEPFAIFLASPAHGCFRCWLPDDGLMSCFRVFIPTGLAYTTGEALLLVLLLALMVTEGYYW